MQRCDLHSLFLSSEDAVIRSADFNDPFTITLIPINTIRTASVVFIDPAIMAVLLMRAFTQIAPPVVKRVSVAVIDLVRGPLPRHPKPSKRPSFVVPPVNPDPEVAVVDVAGGSGDVMRDTGLLQPVESAGFRIVVEHLAQARSGQYGAISHGLVPQDLWSGGVDDSRRPRRRSMRLADGNSVCQPSRHHHLERLEGSEPAIEEGIDRR